MMLLKVLWILIVIFLIQMQETEQKALHRRHKNGKNSKGHTHSKHSRPFLRRQSAAIILKPKLKDLYTLNKPIGFVDKNYQPEARTNQAANAEEIYAEDFRIKNPVIIKDITLKNDSSLSSALENELSIRKLMEELIAKSQLLSSDVGREEISAAIKVENLEEMSNSGKISGKITLDQESKQKMSSALGKLGNQTIVHIADSKGMAKETKTKTASKTVNKELMNLVKGIANPAPVTDPNEKVLLEETFKKAIMQHYWQHILTKAKDIEKKKHKQEEEVNINKENDLNKLVKEGNQNATASTVGILATADNFTIDEVNSKGNTDEKFQAEVANNNKENLMETVGGENSNATEIINAKDYQVAESGSLSSMEKLKSVVANVKSNMTETLQNSEDSTAEQQSSHANIATSSEDLTAYQQDNIDVDDSLIANIDDDYIEHNNINQIFDIQDRSNAIIRILHKDDLQTSKVSKDSNKSTLFNLTSITSDQHPEDIVAMHLDDETLKNQLDFLQSNAPKIKKHKEVLSDKNGLLEVGVSTKNDTELEADFEKAFHEQIHKLAQNFKTAIDFSKDLVNTSLEDSVPLHQTDFYNEDETLELPQFINFYGEESDLPENIEESLTLQQPVVLTEHLQASELKPVMKVAHVQHTTGAKWAMHKISAESALKFEKVTTPPTSLKTPVPITSWMTEKTVETTTSPTSIAIDEEASNNVIASIQQLTEKLEKEAEETTEQLILIRNQAQIGTTTYKWKVANNSHSTLHQNNEENSTEEESAEIAAITQSDILDSEEVEETTAYINVEKDIPSSKNITELLTQEDTLKAGNKTNSPKVENFDGNKIILTEHDDVYVDNATSETTTEKIKTEFNLLENLKEFKNSTVFEGNTTLQASILKNKDVEETTVYHPFYANDAKTEKAIEVVKADHIDIPIKYLINYETTTESPILKAAELTKIINKEEHHKTKVPEVEETTEFAEEYFKKQIADNKQESTTFAAKESVEQLGKAELETTTMRSQLRELKDETHSKDQFSKLKLDTTTSTTDIPANGNLQFNIAEKVIQDEEVLLDKDAEDDYMRLEQPPKAQRVKPVEEEEVNVTEKKTHKEHQELKDNLSVLVEELAKEDITKTQVESVIKEPIVKHKIGLEATVEQSELDNLHELVNQLEKNNITTTKVKFSEETVEIKENNDKQEENKTEKSSTEDNVQVNRGEAEVQNNYKITVGNYNLKKKNSDDITPLVNEKLENENAENTAAEDNDKIGDITTEYSLVVDKGEEKEVEMKEATVFDNDEEETVESSAEYSSKEREEEMNETSLVNNESNKEGTIEEIATEDHEEIEEESSELPAVDNDEATKESIDVGDANIRDEMTQETTTGDGAVTEETLTDDAEIIEDNDKDNVAEESFEETSAKDKSQVENEMGVETSAEHNDRIKEELTAESLIVDSAIVNKVDTEKATPEDIDKTIEGKLAIPIDKDKNQVKEVAKIAVDNADLRIENTKELPTVSNNADKVNDNISEETSAADNVKEDKKQHIKYKIKAAIGESEKIKVISDIVQINKNIIEELPAKVNSGIKVESFEESSTIDNEENNEETKELISVEATDNDGTKDESNKDNVKEVQTDSAAAELTDKSAMNKIKQQIIEKMSEEDSDEIKDITKESIANENKNKEKKTILEATLSIDGVNMKVEKIEDSTAAHRNKVIDEKTQEISSGDKAKVETKETPEQNNKKEKIIISFSAIKNNKVRKENKEEPAKKDPGISEKIPKEELKSVNKIQNKTEVNVNGLKEEVIKETSSVEDKERVKEMTTDSTIINEKKLNELNTKESLTKDSEEVKTERTIPTKSSVNDITKAEMSAISNAKIKANSTEHHWKAEEEIVKIAIEHHNVKETTDKTKVIDEKTESNSFKKPNVKRRRKKPKRPVIKNSTQKSKVDKTKKKTVFPVVKNISQAVEEDTTVEKPAIFHGENKPTKVNNVQLTNIEKNKKLPGSLVNHVKPAIEKSDNAHAENIGVNKLKIEINISKINNTKKGVAKINENADSDKNVDTQQETEHITLSKNDEFPEKTTLLQDEYQQSVKIDKAVLKQIELNVAKKQNATDTKQNIADGNNKLRIILSSKKNPSTTTKKSQAIEHNDKNKKYSEIAENNNTKTINQMKNQTENGQFIETKQNNDEMNDKGLSKTKTNKTNDNKNTEKKNQLQVNDNDSIEVQKLNEDVSSTVNCVTTEVAAVTTDSKDIDDIDKNNQGNSKRLADIKTRAIKRIGTVLTEQQVEDENNKSIEKELNDENNKNAALDEVYHSDAVDVDEFADDNDDDDEMTTLKPVSLTWQQDNSSIAQSKEYEEDEEEQQALESDEVDSYTDDDTTAENDTEIKNQQIEDTEDEKYADKSQELENNASNEEQMKHGIAADSKNNDNDDKTKQLADTFINNNDNVATAKINDDKTMQILKNHKISTRNETTPMPIEIVTAAAANTKEAVVLTDDDNDVTNGVVDIDNDDDAAAVAFADTTQYHANKHIPALEEQQQQQQQQPISNWWSTLHHAEIRKFLNSIFNDAADEFYQEIARQARVELQEIPQRHSVVNDNRHKGSTAHWLSNLWSLW